MGIPGFYRFLQTTFPKNIFGRVPDKNSVYAIDGNGLVHSVCQEVFKYGKETSTPYSLTVEEYNNHIKIALNKIWEEIIKSVKLIKPTMYFIFAIDGVAPQAKIVQQRKRRYLSSKNKSQALDGKIMFDGNQITPGTYFMDLLDQMLKSRFSSTYKEDFFPQQIIYSSYKDPGEGEHKIASFIRENLGILSGKGNIIIDGLDADLFMIYLAMTSPKHPMILLRKSHTQYNYLYLNNFKFENKEDLILKTFLIGNDFLPRLIEVKEIDNVLKSIFEETFKTQIVSNKEIVWRNLADWLWTINDENALKNLENYALLNFPTSFIIQQRDRGEVIKEFNVQTFRNDWYKHLYSPESKQFNVTDNDMYFPAYNYLKGMNWILSYYLKGYNAIDTEWYYPHLYPPLLFDIINYIRGISEEQLFNSMIIPFNNLPLHVHEQLLMVLPPKSQMFVPKEYQILYSINSPIADYYPIDFKVDKNGFPDTMKHEFIPLIPIIYLPRLRNAMRIINPNYQQVKIEESMIVFNKLS